jgi:Tol biopolymer transport system component
MPGPRNGARDVFLGATCVEAAGCTPATLRVSVAGAGTEADGSSTSPSISWSGRYLAFASDATNLVAGDDSGRRDVFARDTCIGAPEGCVPATRRVSVSASGAQADGDRRA